MTAVGIRGFVIAVALLAATPPAAAKTYLCEASPKKALLGISALLAVSITEDTSNQECRFSVNGETVGSPPRELVISAYNAFRTMQVLASPTWNMFAYALLASSPGSEVPGELRSVLEKELSGLSACVQGLASGKIDTFVSTSNLFCRIVRGDGEVSRVGFGSSGIQFRPTTPSEPPQLVLGYNGGAIRHYLFMPMFYVRGLPPLQ